MNQIADGVFCETGWEGANVGAVLTDDGAILIDSPMLPRDARTWKEQVVKTSGGPPLSLINTDYHFDHIMTDCLLCERVIVHSAAEPAFEAQGGEVFEQMVGAFFPDTDEESRREVRALRSVTPYMTFSENLTLNPGRRLEIMHLGGHTPATAVVFLPDDGILFTGDAHEHDRHPFSGDADLLQWIEALGRIEKMGAGKIVPGHGEVCGLESVGRLKAYFEEMKGRVLDLIKRGCGRNEVEERVDILSFFPVEEGKEARTRSFVELGIGRMYDQLVESPQG